MRKLILPGEKINGPVEGPSYREGNSTYSSVLGILEEQEGGSRIIPLQGRYIPREGDYIVGIVTEAKFGGCMVDINAPNMGYLRSEREYKTGDVISAMIAEINEVRSVELEDDCKLLGGNVIEISPVKIPRVIGKKNSMVDMLSQYTKSEIRVGRNGRIWMRSGDIALVERAMCTIQSEAHKPGLTEKIKKMLENEMVKS